MILACHRGKLTAGCCTLHCVCMLQQQTASSHAQPCMCTSLVHHSLPAACLQQSPVYRVSMKRTVI